MIDRWCIYESSELKETSCVLEVEPSSYTWPDAITYFDVTALSYHMHFVGLVIICLPSLVIRQGQKRC